MLRLIASIVLELMANAVGLLAASWILRPAFSIDAIGFIMVVAIFTAVRFILAPLVVQLSMRYARMLVGGVSLVTILVSLYFHCPWTSFTPSAVVRSTVASGLPDGVSWPIAASVAKIKSARNEIILIMAL